MSVKASFCWEALQLKGVFKALSAAMLLAVLLAHNAVADEVWRTGAGTIVYEIDRGAEAILSFPVGGSGERGEIVLQGMGGQYNNRAVFFGYWSAAEGERRCGGTVTDRRGNRQPFWGRAAIIFNQPGFPSAITLLRGICTGPLQPWLVAEPVVGGPR